MILYTFVNYYLSSIQQGIQTAHIVSELSLQGHPLFIEWAKNYKTIAILNGGNAKGVEDTWKTLVDIGVFADINLPKAKFHEDDESLGGALTACGIVIPQLICEEIQLVRNKGATNVMELSKFIAQFSLAK